MSTFDKEMMVEVQRLVAKSIADQDAALLASLYRPSATMLPADGRVITGTDAIIAEAEAWFAGGLLSQRVEDVELVVDDSVAVEYGVAVAELADGSEAVSNYLVVHVREADGSWLMDRDIWTREGGAQGGGY